MARYTRSYGIETMADAVFTLERSEDPVHRAMAADCHTHGTGKMVDTARRLAAAKIACAEAR